MKNIFVLLTALCLLSISQAQTQEVCNGSDDDGDGLIDETMPSGIKLNLPFTGNANDVSGFGNNGTVFGATLTTDRFSSANSAYNFSGSSTVISVPPSSLLLNEYTYSAWFKLSSLPTTNNYYCIIAIGGVTDDQHVLVANHPGPGNIGIGAGSYDIVHSSHHCYQGSLPSINQWYHVVVTRNNSFLKIYVNNSLICSVANSANASYFPSPYYANIGARDNPNSQNFKGAIDDVMIFERVLTTTEITTLYQNTGGMATGCVQAPIPTLSQWGLIILALLMVAMSTVFMLNRQVAFAGGNSTVTSSSSFFRQLPFDGQLYKRVLLVLLPVAVLGFFVVHFLIGTNGALDFTGTLVSAGIVGYVVHLLVGRRS